MGQGACYACPMNTKLLFLLTSLFGLLNSCFADEWVTDPNSNSWKNTDHVANYLIDIGEVELASYLGAALAKGKIYRTPELTDWWGVKLRGLTNGNTFNVGFRNDVLPAEQELSLKTNLQSYELGRAALYFAIATHEMIHYRDLQFPNRFSPELDTYQRSFVIYIKALAKTLREWKEYEDAGNEFSVQLRRRAKALASLIYDEMSTYDDVQYGEITDLFRPLDYHRGCVRNLNIDEMANYALILSGQLGQEAKSYAEVIEGFDREARFEYSARGGDCLDVWPLIPSPSSGMASGLEKSFLRFKAYRLPAIPSKHVLDFVKRGSSKNKVILRLINLEGESEDEYRSLGTISSYQDQGSIYVPANGAGNLALVVSESEEGVFPESESDFNLRLTHRWSDANGSVQEAPVLVGEEMGLQSLAKIGFYPVATFRSNLDFRAESPRIPGALERQGAFFLFNGSENQKVRFAIPDFDQRLVSLYKIGSQNPDTGLLQLSRIPTDYSENSQYSIKEKGSYLLSVSRLFAQKIPRSIEVEMVIANEPDAKQNPALAQLHVPNQQELAGMGIHPVFKRQLSFSHETEDMPAGFSHGEISKGLNPLSRFTLFDLDLKGGDLVKITGTKLFLDMFFAVVEFKNGKMLTMPHSSPIDFTANKDSRYFLLAETTSTVFNGRASGTFHIEVARADRLGPSAIKASEIPFEKIASEYGYEKPIIHRLENYFITAAHPKGFSLADSYFQLFKFSLDRECLVRAFKPQLGIPHRLFLTKVDQESFRLNRPSLDTIFYMTQENSFDNFRKVGAGEYIVAVETGWQTGPGEVPFELDIGCGKQSPKQIPLTPLDTAQMRDIRYRMK